MFISNTHELQNVWLGTSELIVPPLKTERNIEGVWVGWGIGKGKQAWF